MKTSEWIAISLAFIVLGTAMFVWNLPQDTYIEALKKSNTELVELTETQSKQIVELSELNDLVLTIGIELIDRSLSDRATIKRLCSSIESLSRTNSITQRYIEEIEEEKNMRYQRSR